MFILDAVVHRPGSSSKSEIWKESSLRHFLAENSMIIPPKNFLLGSHSYPLEPWLLVPYEDCLKSEELIFNDHVYRAMTVVQMCAATLKARFRSIHHNCGPLYYSPEKCSKLVAACIILHNICVKMRIALNKEVNLDEDFLEMTEWDIDEEDEEETMIR